MENLGLFIAIGKQPIDIGAGYFNPIEPCIDRALQEIRLYVEAHFDGGIGRPERLRDGDLGRGNRCGKTSRIGQKQISLRRDRIGLATIF